MFLYPLLFMIVAALSSFNVVLPYRPIRPPLPRRSPSPTAEPAAQATRRVPVNSMSRPGWPGEIAGERNDRIQMWKNRLTIVLQQATIAEPSGFKVKPLLEECRSYVTSNGLELELSAVYDEFIEAHQNSTYQRAEDLAAKKERHHIVPMFEGGIKQDENVVMLSLENHMLAHFLRYLAYGKNEDAAMVIFRAGYSEEGRRVAQKSSLDKMKDLKKGRWDSEAQRELGKKGGKKGGSANTEEQFAARQKVGKEYGKLTGLANQSDSLKTLLKGGLTWTHEEFPNQTFYTVPCESGNELIRQLNAFAPEQKIKEPAAFYKVLHGKRPKMYGWKLVDTAIRSEAEGGKGPSERSETSA